ncbi:MAG: hypothetical protein IE886_06255 [Campylobacterales bacterium]|nr:hypothetical protein [Campylobacterales bacterium]
MKETIAPEFLPLVDAVEAHLLGKRHAITLTLAAANPDPERRLGALFRFSVIKT